MCVCVCGALVCTDNDLWHDLYNAAHRVQLMKNALCLCCDIRNHLDESCSSQKMCRGMLNPNCGHFTTPRPPSARARSPKLSPNATAQPEIFTAAALRFSFSLTPQEVNHESDSRGTGNSQQRYDQEIHSVRTCCAQFCRGLVNRIFEK